MLILSTLLFSYVRGVKLIQPCGPGECCWAGLRARPELTLEQPPHATCLAHSQSSPMHHVQHAPASGITLHVAPGTSIGVCAGHTMLGYVLHALHMA